MPSIYFKETETPKDENQQKVRSVFTTKVLPSIFAVLFAILVLLLFIKIILQQY